MKNSKNSTPNDCRKAWPGVPGDHILGLPNDVFVVSICPWLDRGATHFMDHVPGGHHVLLHVFPLKEHLLWVLLMMYLSSLDAGDLIDVRHTLLTMFSVIMTSSMVSSFTLYTCSRTSNSLFLIKLNIWRSLVLLKRSFIHYILLRRQKRLRFAPIISRPSSL